MTKIIKLLERFVVICRDKEVVVRVAESCTGGRLASYLTKLAGASNYFDYGLVVYSNKAKQSLLQIPEDILHRYGAVSAETAVLMAEHLSSNESNNLTIATTGICGPMVHQSDDLGLVYVATHYDNKTYVERFKFTADREGNIQLAVEAALNMAIQTLQAKS